MRLSKPDADFLVPDGLPVEAALERTTHLAVGAHQDDIEFMAVHGILECFQIADRWFTGVTVTDGAGSPRVGAYAGTTDAEMRRIRLAEQRKAAIVGEYGCQIQLMYASSELRDPQERGPVDDLGAILELAAPRVVYLHNPADRHDSHVACCLRSLAALRRLPPDRRPDEIWGCEVWRDLDWLTDADREVLPVDDRANLAAALAAVFDSQIGGGKRYDLAVQGRRLAHATFHQSHAVDRHHEVSFAMDLRPLVDDPQADPAEFAAALLRRTEAEVRDRIARMSGEATPERRDTRR